jgi:hypothetical protein
VTSPCRFNYSETMEFRPQQCASLLPFLRELRLFLRISPEHRRAAFIG